MQIYVPDTFPYAEMYRICEVIGHDWEKGKARWKCVRCSKTRRRRNRAGGR